MSTSRTAVRRVAEDDVGIAANLLLAMGLSTNEFNLIVEQRRWFEVRIHQTRVLPHHFRE